MMNWIHTRMKWVMLVSGGLTSTMVTAAISPQTSLTSMFGETLEGAVAEIVVRSWGVLIFLVGGMLIYGAFHPPSRPLILTVAGLSKLVFIALVLVHGSQFLAHQVGVAIAIDTLMVALFAAYLIAARRHGG